MKIKEHIPFSALSGLLIFILLFLADALILQSQNTWVRKADVGGFTRRCAVAFAIGSKGYVGTGITTEAIHIKSFWEYNSLSNSWTQKVDFPGGIRAKAVGFSIGNKGYIGMGCNGILRERKKDFWEYDPSTNTWKRIADFGGKGRMHAVAFSIGNKGYVGTGDISEGEHQIDFWEYNPLTDKWTRKADFQGIERDMAVGFSIGNRGYIGTGIDGGYGHKDFWEYNPLTNKWTRKADFGGTGRHSAVGFSIGNRGYIGTGFEIVNKRDFWEYNPGTNKWRQIASFGGTARVNAIAFSIGNKGYVGTGYDVTSKRDFWEYSPDNDAGSFKKTSSDSCSVEMDNSDNEIISTVSLKAFRDVCIDTLPFALTGGMPVNGIYSGKGIINGIFNPALAGEGTHPIAYTFSDTRGCSISGYQTVKVNNCQGISGKGEGKIALSPNPTNGVFTLSFKTEINTPVLIEITNENGQVIYTHQQQNVMEEYLRTVDMSAHAKGIYLLRLTTDTETLSWKIIVE